MQKIFNKLVEIIILGVVQGLTEWFPISSSGHLVIVKQLLGSEGVPILLPLTLHVGTLCVILFMFWSDVAEILRALARFDLKSDEGKLATYIAVGSVPTGIIGFFFHDLFESFFHNLLAVGLAMLTTGSFLYISQLGKNGKKMNWLDSLLIGTAQGLAIIPGISRSGATITAGLLRGVEKEKAFRYSFLLSIPAIIGAAVTESIGLDWSNADAVILLLGAVVSMIVGYASLRLLLKVVLRGKFHLFAFYCWIVGAMLVFSQVLQPL